MLTESRGNLNTISTGITTALVLSIVVSVFIPLVAALLTRSKWSKEVTGYLSLLLSAISGFCVEWAQASDISHFNWKVAALNAIVAYVVAVSAHVGAWTKTSVEASLHAFPGQPAQPPAAA